MLFFIWKENEYPSNLSHSNTSHVILYLNGPQPGCRQLLFKYISCYSLSRGGICNVSGFNIQIHLMLFFILGWFVLASLLIKFKYISCYSLSLRRRLLVHVSLIQIHLMLFFICIFYCIYSVLSCIQIHLMLFFILVDEEVQKLLTRFKYISCYSLSRQKEGNHGRGDIQIHLMLFFINPAYGCLSQFCQFKYISCYSLSPNFRHP